MITTDQIAEAEQAHAAAERALDRAERGHAMFSSKTASGDLLAARGVEHNARDRLRMLRTGYARQQEQRRARQAAEAAYEGERAKTEARLTTARQRAADAVTEARGAVARMLAAIAAYDTLTRELADDLRCRGLVADGEDTWGGTRGGAVHLGGEVFVPVDGGSLLGGLVADAVRQVAPRHPIARARLADTGGPGSAAGRRALLEHAARG